MKRAIRIICVQMMVSICGIATLSADLVEYNHPNLLRIQQLYAEAGNILPTVVYPIRRDRLHSSLEQLLLHVEEKEHALLAAVERWEQQRESLEQRVTEELQSSEAQHPVDEEPSEVLQVLVWPAPNQDHIPAHLQNSIDTLYATRPHERFEAVQSLRIRIEDELDYWSAQGPGDQVTLEQTMAVQGFVNLDTGALAPKRYLAMVDPILETDFSADVPNGPGIQLSVAAERSYRSGQEISNLPIPEDQNRILLNPNILRRAVLYLPYRNGELLAGRFSSHIGPGQNSLSFNSALPFIDGARSDIQAGNFGFTSLIGMIPSHESGAGDASSEWFPEDSMYGFGRTDIYYVVHYAQLSGERIRVGFGGQNMIAAVDNSIQSSVLLPVSGWMTESDSVNTQLITDISLAPHPWLEIYLQGGLQRPVGGWLDIPDTGAVLAGIRFLSSTEQANTKAHVEGGWTSSDWGSFPESRALSRFVHRFEMGSGVELMPISSPFGPGVIWGGGAVDLELRNGFVMGFYLDIIGRQQEIDLFAGSFPASPGSRLLEAYFGANLGLNWEEILEFQLLPGVLFQNNELRPHIGAEIRIHGRIF